MFLLILEVLTMITLLGFLPLIQERLHWIKYLGVRVSIAEFDVDDGASMSLLQSLNHYVTPCIQFF